MKLAQTRDRHDFDGAMDALLVYDNFDLARSANAMLLRMAQRPHEPTCWNVKPWRVGVLKLPPAAEAARAHLVLLAMLDLGSLLPGLMDWLDHWAKCRQVRDASLAIWDGENAKTCTARAAEELSRFAARHGLSLIHDNNPQVDNASLVSTDLLKREVSLTSTLQDILQRPAVDGYQHWGIKSEIRHGCRLEARDCNARRRTGRAHSAHVPARRTA